MVASGLAEENKPRKHLSFLHVLRLIDLAKAQRAVTPRREYARVLPDRHAFQIRRAQGMPDAQRTHGLVCKGRKHTS
jgi:hypothetical protein